MSYGGGNYRYSPLSKYASTHGQSGTSHGLSGNSSLYSPYVGLSSNPYVSPYSSQLSPGLGSGLSSGYSSQLSPGLGSGLGSGYSSRSGSTSSLSSIGSIGSAGSYPGTTTHIPYRVGSFFVTFNSRVIKLFSCRMKFQLLIKTKMLKKVDFFPLKLSDVVFILVINV